MCSNELLANAAATGLAAEGASCSEHSDCGANHCGWVRGAMGPGDDAVCCCRGYFAGYCYGLDAGETCSVDSQCESRNCELVEDPTGIVGVVAIARCGEAAAFSTTDVTENDLSKGIVAAYLSSQVYVLEAAARNEASEAEVERMPCFPDDAVAEYLPETTECTGLRAYFDETFSAYGYTATLNGAMVAVFAGTTPDPTDTMDLQIDGMSAFSSAVLLGPDGRSFGAGAGFVLQYDAMRAEGFDPATLCARNEHVLVTGHSLGGAVANLAAVDLLLHGCSVELTTFGAPRTFAVLTSETEDALGNGAVDVQAMIEGEDRFTARRWVNEGDGVTSIPPTLMDFEHVATDVISMHHMWWWKDDAERTFSFEAQDYSAYNGGVTIGLYHLMTAEYNPLVTDSAVNGYIPRILEGLGHRYSPSGSDAAATTATVCAAVAAALIATFI